MKKLISVFLVLTFNVMHLSADNTSLNQQIWELSKEKRQLTMKVSKALREHNLSEDPRLAAAQEKAFKASKELVSTKKNHPDLKQFITKSDAAQDKMIDAAVAKDDAAKKAAQKEFMDARRELETAAQKIPEIQALQKKAIDINNQTKAVELEILSEIPEGKELTAEIKALDKKIADLRSQLKK